MEGELLSVKQIWRLQGGGKGKGGGGGCDTDDSISSLAILMCKGRLFTRVFSRSALVFFFPFLFFSFFNDGDVEHMSARKREQRGLVM